MKNISVEKLKGIIENNGNDVNLLDVRTQEERNLFNIGGYHITIDEIMLFQFEEIEDLKNKPIYVYCRSGKRSLHACLILEQAGFTNLYNLEGGMLEWQASLL